MSEKNSWPIEEIHSASYFALSDPASDSIALLCKVMSLERCDLRNEVDFVVVNGAWTGMYEYDERAVYETDERGEYKDDRWMPVMRADVLWVGEIPAKVISQGYQEMMAWVERIRSIDQPVILNRPGIINNEEVVVKFKTRYSPVQVEPKPESPPEPPDDPSKLAIRWF